MLLEFDAITPYNEIQEIAAAKEPYEKLWSTAVKFRAQHKTWMKSPVIKVNSEEVEEEVCYLYSMNYRGKFLYTEDYTYIKKKVKTVCETNTSYQTDPKSFDTLSIREFSFCLVYNHN